MIDILLKISTYSVLAPLIAGIFRLKIIEGKLRVIIIILFFASISQFASIFFDSGNGTLWTIYNGYLLIDFILWSVVFYTAIHSFYFKKAIIMVAFIFVCLYLIFALKSSLNSRFFYELVCVSSAIILIWALRFFYEIYLDVQVRSLIQFPMFWICSGNLIYLPGTFLLFAFYNSISILLGKETSNSLWNIHSILNSLMYVFFTVGFLMKPSKKTIA